MDEISIYEDFLEVDFRAGIPVLIENVSSYFGISISQINLLTWKTLIAIEVLHEFHGISFGVHEFLYIYYFAHFG